MKKNILILLLASLCFTAFNPSNAFAERMQKTQAFYYDIANFASNAKDFSEVYVFVWISHTHLQFIKSGEKYLARYQINLEVYTKSGTAVLTKDATFRTELDNYVDTIDKEQLQRYMTHFSLKTGEYKFKIRLVDLNSGQSTPEEVTKKIQPLSDTEISISDILILNKADFDTLKAEYVLPPQQVPITDSLFVYTQITIPSDIPETVVSVSRQQNEKKTFANNVLRTTGIFPFFIKWKKEMMSHGACELVIEADGGNKHVEARKKLIFYGSINELSIGSLDDKVDQLRYVAPSKEWWAMKKAKGDEKVRLFKEFWEKRDPSPGTPENELFNEYYKRVRLANEQFSDGNRPGWATDRGHVFIVYGPPDHVERNSNSFDSIGSYEVWYYDDLNKKFVFLDDKGFGDYRLVSGFID